MQLDLSLLTDLIGLTQRHPYLYPLPALPWVLQRLKPDRLKAYVRSIGDVYVESCRTAERCVRGTQHLVSCIRHKAVAPVNGVSRLHQPEHLHLTHDR